MNPTIITGCHRSGTSLVSGLLYKCGMYLGPENRLLPPGGDNPTGFWENKDIMTLNGKILLSCGGDWVRPKIVTIGESLSIEEYEMFKTKALNIISSEFFEHSWWGMKDPRFCFTLSFWYNLFPHMQVIVCLRDPYAVKASLERRSKDFPRDRGLSLWEEYNKACLYNVSRFPVPCKVVKYDSFFEDSDKALKSLLDWLDISVTSKRREEARSLISASLKHHKGEMDEVGFIERLNLYNFMKQLSEDNEVHF